MSHRRAILRVETEDKAMLELDFDEELPWLHGLKGLAWRGATVLVHVDGLDVPVGGELSHADDEAIVIVTPDHDDPERGLATWVPRDRVISVAARFRQADLQAERQRRVAGDTDLLDQVREIALHHLDDVRYFDRKTVRAPIPATVAAELDQDVPIEDIIVALEILVERGDLPPAQISDS
jgi:hypothetical protein